MKARPCALPSGTGQYHHHGDHEHTHDHRERISGEGSVAVVITIAKTALRYNMMVACIDDRSTAAKCKWMPIGWSGGAGMSVHARPSRIPKSTNGST
jgi:hypothetical protein